MPFSKLARPHPGYHEVRVSQFVLQHFFSISIFLKDVKIWSCSHSKCWVGVLLVDSTKLSNTFSETNKMREWKKEKDGLYLVNAILVKHLKGILILYG